MIDAGLPRPTRSLRVGGERGKGGRGPSGDKSLVAEDWRQMLGGYVARLRLECQASITFVCCMLALSPRRVAPCSVTETVADQGDFLLVVSAPWHFNDPHSTRILPSSMRRCVAAHSSQSKTTYTEVNSTFIARVSNSHGTVL